MLTDCTDLKVLLLLLLSGSKIFEGIVCIFLKLTMREKHKSSNRTIAKEKRFPHSTNNITVSIDRDTST